MMRGTFGNIRIKNQLVGPKQGSLHPEVSRRRTEMFNYDAAMAVQGRRYAPGRPGRQGIRHRLLPDWAAKGTNLLGIKAVITQSYERIHRNNLVGMGALPLVFADGESAQSLGLDGSETFTISGVAGMTPRKQLAVKAVKADGSEIKFSVTSRLDTEVDVEYFENGGILPCVIRKMMAGGFDDQE
jgi:aconitate hydratase